MGGLPEEYKIFHTMQNFQAKDFSLSNPKRMLLAEETKLKTSQNDYVNKASYADRSKKQQGQRTQRLPRQGCSGKQEYTRKDDGSRRKESTSPEGDDKQLTKDKSRSYDKSRIKCHRCGSPDWRLMA